MTGSSPQTPEGVLLTRLVPELLRPNGRLLAAGDAMTRDLGLTSARWQVVGAVRLAGGPLPVAWIARNTGLTRQAVQRAADELAAEGSVRFTLVNVAEWTSAEAFLGAAATGEFRELTRGSQECFPHAGSLPARPRLSGVTCRRQRWRTCSRKRSSAVRNVPPASSTRLAAVAMVLAALSDRAARSERCA